MSQSPDVVELDNLVDQLCDGVLTLHDAQRLENLVLNAPDLRQQYIETLHLHAALRWNQAEPVEFRVELPRLTENIESHKLLESPSKTRPTPRSIHFSLSGLYSLVSHHVLWSISLVAVVTYGAFVLIAWNLRPDKLSTLTHANDFAVAAINNSVNVHWSSESMPKTNGSPVNKGELFEIDSGILELQLKQGATVLLEGPARFSIDDINRATLSKGRLVAKVAPQAIGFMVETPHAKIVDLGTEFGVSVDEQGATEAQVFRGAIEIESVVKESQAGPKATLKRRLVAGEAARVDATTKVPQIQSVVAKPDQFLRQLPSPSNEHDHEPSAYAKYVIEKSKPVLYWNFDNPFRTVTRDLVQSHPAENFLPSSINQPGPRPSDGFHLMAAENRAATVAGGGNISIYQLNTKLSVPTDAYSMQIWFNSSVPFGDQAHNYLLCRGNSSQRDIGLRDSVIVAGNYEPQKLNTGCLAFFSNAVAGETKAVAGKTVLSPDRWYLATFVRDGDRICIYLDGALEIDAECVWQGGEGEYLTFGHRVDLLAGLGLSGRFDEVAVWDRALQENEVVAAYRLAIDKELLTKQ